MPFRSLNQLIAVLLFLTGLSPALGQDPHLDQRLVPGSCRTCHSGHGQSMSPMLPEPQKDVCLRCHGSQADLVEAIQSNDLAADAQPPLLANTLTGPSIHPLTEGAFSRLEEGSITCTSCHSPHRGSRRLIQSEALPNNEVAPRGQLLSTANPMEFQFELCQRCHGDQGLTTLNLADMSRLTDPASRSSHPIQKPANSSSPSLKPDFANRQMSCTDCHGNSDRTGPRGPHGSLFSPILRQNFVASDGSPDSEETYALCYSCHDRQRVLDSPLFPLHRSHIEGFRASCSTCHNPHGSAGNRALISYGEETAGSGVNASMRSGVLAFESLAPGQGSCFVTCHGVDHSPASYGGAQPMDTQLGLEPVFLDDPFAIGIPEPSILPGGRNRPPDPPPPPSR